MPDLSASQKSWFYRVFGRSLIRVFFGNFFENKNNTASIIAILLVLTLCYVVVAKGELTYMTAVTNVIFVVIGYYFGAKQRTEEEED